MPSKLYTSLSQVKVPNIWKWAMPKKLPITTLVKDNKMYCMSRAVSKDTVCDYSGVSRFGMTGLQWNRCLLVERYGGKLLLSKHSEYWLPDINQINAHDTTKWTIIVNYAT